ncbi:MAG: oligopeptide/dipeptide ABC transporter ATP-binding protein [Nitrososphaerales archaeon]
MSQIQLNVNNHLAGSRPLLKVGNLSVTFSKEFGFLGRRTRTTNAVDNVSFELFPNETLSLVGESGSGKTTIARCISALATPTSGSVLYNGEDVTKISGSKLLAYRKEVQIIFQDPFGSLSPFQNVFSVVATPIRRLVGERDHEKISKRVLELLDEVGLEPNEIVQKLPHQLSGGERQRVNIARALASQPKILVADEPVSMLDASQRLNTLYLLMELQARHNLSILMITHDLATSKVMRGRTAVLYLGKLVEIGSTEGVLTGPHHPYTELLISAAPRTKFLTESPVEVPASTIEKSEGLVGGCVFRNRCKYATQVCIDVEPPLEQKSDNRTVACHNWLNRK